MNEIAQIDQAARELDLARARIAELERELDLRKTDAEQLRSSEEKYRTLVESSPYCIKLVDGDGRLLSMNRAGLEMVGDFRFQGFDLLVSDRDFRSRFIRIVQQAFDGCFPRLDGLVAFSEILLQLGKSRFGLGGRVLQGPIGFAAPAREILSTACHTVPRYAACIR